MGCMTKPASTYSNAQRGQLDHVKQKKEARCKTRENSLAKYSVKKKQPLSSNNMLACWSIKSKLPDFKIFKEKLEIWMFIGNFLVLKHCMYHTKYG